MQTTTEKRIAVVATAISYLGVSEKGGEAAQLFSHGEPVDWCANFVTTCMGKHGVVPPGNHWLWPSVAFLLWECMRARVILEVIPEQGVLPEPGDLVFFDFRQDDNRVAVRHVGLVEKVEEGKVHTIEGNTSNMVARRVYPLTDKRIVAYGQLIR